MLKRSMAADPGWLNGWIEKNGPYLYHATSPDHIESIKQHGLIPWDHPIPGGEPGKRGPYVGGDMEPRPGHVYLGTPNQVGPYPGQAVRVDLRKLNPQSINADEDSMMGLGKPWNPITDPEFEALPDADKVRGGVSYGEWANSVPLNDPLHVKHSLGNYGAIAHEGVVPPEAISDVSREEYEAYEAERRRQLTGAAKVTNILDPIHDTLPDIWLDPGGPEPKLKPQLRNWIVKHINEVIQASEFGDPSAWLSLVLTGSLTTYQYGPTSDCDVSLFVDTSKLPDWDRAKLIGLMIDKMDGTKLPGTTYEMQDFVVPEGIKKEDLYQQGLRSGYDLAEDRWINPPERSRIHDVEHEYNAFYVYSLLTADKMERLLKYEPDKATKFWHQIHRRRQRDQRAGKGDFSESNIAYKMLAQRGLLPEIAAISGEHIASEKFAYARAGGPKQKLVHKFIFDPDQQKLVIGPLAAQEGAVDNHAQLIRSIGADPSSALAGIVNEPGYVQWYRSGAPKDTLAAQEALLRAMPHAQFVNPQDDPWGDDSLWDE